MSRTLFRNCAVLIAGCAADRVLRDGALLVNGKHIEAIGASPEVERLCAGTSVDVIDCLH
jgi:nicotinate-nucleotide pyrophosphorylase